MPQWYAVHTFTRFLHDDLHNREKLLMAILLQFASPSSRRCAT